MRQTMAVTQKNMYEQIDGANCQTLFGERISQKDAAVRAVERIGLNRIKEIRREIFSSLPQFYEMFCERLQLLQSIDCHSRR